MWLIVIWLGSEAASPLAKLLLVFFGLIICFITWVAGLTVWNAWRANRYLDDAIKTHLRRPLSAVDEEQFCRIARMYPQTRPWIAVMMDHNGMLDYRHALPLAWQINDYLATLPPEDLKAVLFSGSAKGQP